MAANEPKLIAGNANLPLAKAIARRMSLHRGLTIDLVDARVERFNDQEIFVEVFENVRGEDMYIIQPTSNPANDNLMELLVTLDARNSFIITVWETAWLNHNAIKSNFSLINIFE